MLLRDTVDVSEQQLNEIWNSTGIIARFLLEMHVGCIKIEIICVLMIPSNIVHSCQKTGLVWSSKPPTSEQIWNEWVMESLCSWFTLCCHRSAVTESCTWRAKRCERWKAFWYLQFVIAYQSNCEIVRLGVTTCQITSYQASLLGLHILMLISELSREPSRGLVSQNFLFPTFRVIQRQKRGGVSGYRLATRHLNERLVRQAAWD